MYLFFLYMLRLIFDTVNDRTLAVYTRMSIYIWTNTNTHTHTHTHTHVYIYTHIYICVMPCKSCATHCALVERRHCFAFVLMKPFVFITYASARQRDIYHPLSSLSSTLSQSSQPPLPPKATNEWGSSC